MTKRTIYILAGLCLPIVLAAGLSAQKTPTIDVTGPTIVAFFAPVTDADLSKSPDTNEALSDFQFYAGQARQPLEKRGVTFHEVYAHTFKVRSEKATTVIDADKFGVGYYFVAPGKKPRLDRGVMADVGLLQIADEYFGTKTK